MNLHHDKISDDLIPLNLSQVEALDRNATDSTSREYYESCQITSAIVYRNKLSGHVGNFLESNKVEITIHGNEITSFCSCQESREICRHAVSLLYSWVNDGIDFTNIETVLEEIREMDKDSLVDVISNIIRINPSYIDIFLAKHKPEWDEIDPNPVY
ncbi:MAG: hypothetical protein GWP06_13695 [Actinobacteria bacterium]|nr:hypothetical protein [Actinomycetota bacterium]